MLKETRAPAVVVSRGKLDDEVGYAVADGLTEFFAKAAASGEVATADPVR
jgi:hypothetical protein